MKRIVLFAVCALICAAQFSRAALRAFTKTSAPLVAKKTHFSQTPATVPPATYNATTSTDVIPYPSTPPIPGPAGSTVTEPEFHVQVLRVTDGGTLGMRFPDWDFVTPGAAMQNTFSVDSRLFYVIGEGMHILVFRFDPAQMRSTFTGLDLSRQFGWGDTSFSTVNPHIAYGFAAGMKGRIDRYDFSSRKERTVLNPSSCLTHSGGFRGLDLSVSAGDSRILGVFGPQEDEDPYLVVWDAKQGCRWYDTKTGEIGGNWGPKGLATSSERFGIHQARISLNGEYAVIAGGGARHVWDIDTLQVESCAKEDSCDGHFAIGYNKFVNAPGVRDDMDVVIRPLANLTAPVEVIRTFPGPTEWDADNHWSWNNDDPADTNPVCGSTYLVTNPSTPGAPLMANRAWDNEIICFATTGQQTVWRFAHTYSTAHNGFFSTPRGNVSQDGRFYMFSSDWEDDLGKDRSGHFRTDVFIVPLN
jgi:hypothetical protein